MKELSKGFVLFILVIAVLIGCSSDDSDTVEDSSTSGDTSLEGEAYTVVGEEVFTNFVEDRYKGLEIEFISAGFVSPITDEIHDRYPIPESNDGHLLLEVEVTNTTDDPISNYEFVLTSEPLEGYNDEEYTAKYISSSQPISLSSRDEGEYEEQLDFLSKYKLLSNSEHAYLPNSSERGLHLLSFPSDEMLENVYIHTSTLEGELMFELEAAEETWNFSDVEYTVDYTNYQDELHNSN